MTTLKDLQDQLPQLSCHFTWNLEYKSIKQFQSLMDLINEHIAESPAMVIEGRLFKSYLCFSDFKGNIEKQKSEAIECLNEVRTILQGDRRNTCLKDGYLLVTLALEAWLDRRDKTKLEAKLNTLRKLESKYLAGSSDRDMFLGSMHATKGFAFSRLGMIRYSESIEQFRKAVDMCPDEKDWWFSLGFMIWRTSKASVNRSAFTDDMRTAEDIFYKVLKMDRNHSYAMVLIAEIKRRKQNTRKAKEFLKSALRPKPIRNKIIGEVAQVYRRMKYFDEALKVLNSTHSEPSSFIHHQLYTVYRDMKIPPPIDYLQKAINADPSNMAAKFDQAKEYISQNEFVKAQEYFYYILDNNKNDPYIVIQTNYQFARCLIKIGKLDDAIDKLQSLVDQAVEECTENNEPPYIFFKEIDWMVHDSIKRLKGYYQPQADRNDKGSILKLAELEKKLGNFRETCRYYEMVIELQPPVEARLKWTILEDLSKIKSKTMLLTDVDSIIQDMEQLSLETPNPVILEKCKANLAVGKGKVAFQDGKKNDALDHFLESVKFGSLEGARFLLDEVKQTNRGTRDFYTISAHIYCCLEKNGEDDKKELKDDLDKLLSGDTSSTGIVLCDLRKTQLKLEMCCIVGDEQLAFFRNQIINKSRTILNQTMAKFRDCHYGSVRQSCKFFNLPKCSSAKVKKNVRYRLHVRYKWDNFENQYPDLFKFLVSIQPAWNPRENNWMFAWLEMDNEYKHASGLGEKLKVNVYSDKFGNMVEQEFTTLIVARKACDNIGIILNEFYKYL